jgi:RNA polymerase sigma-70 factor (ECF subfamily)
LISNAARQEPASLAADDEALVGRARAGDLDAFRELVERHRSLVTRVAARVVGSDDAEDIAQETFLRVYHRLGQFRGESPFRAWLLRIAHNVALNSIARKQLPRANEDESAEDVVDERGLTRMPAEALESEERRLRLQDKLQLLPAPHRTALVLRELEGLSYEEIADATEAPLGSVKGRIHRARQELIELLRANTYDWELPT